MSRSVASQLLILAVVIVAGAGCFGVSDQPQLGRVTGTITLDGQPLEGVIVNFQPESGRAATAESDSKGYYDLVYIYGSNGAKVGKNAVSFRWPDGSEGKKPIPAKYAGKSELTADVKAGNNELNWELTSNK